MAHDGVENNSGTQNVEQQLQQKVASQTAEQVKQELDNLENKVKEVKTAIAVSLQSKKTQHYFEGKKEDEDSPKGKANSIKDFIQRIFVAAKTSPEKVPSAEKPAQTEPTAAPQTPESTKLINKLGEKIHIEDINEQNAPYFYDIIRSITNGEIKTAQDLAREIGRAGDLQLISPGMFEKLQKTGVEYAVSNNVAEKDAKEMFGVPEHENQPKTQEERLREQAETLDERNFDQNWQQYFSSYFNNQEDHKLIETLYFPKKFISYYKEVQEKIRTDYRLTDKEEIGKRASAEMEVKISLLFAKLYAKLDHESPKEFFQTIEQEDIMRGITPVKSELKRRIQRLAGDLHAYEHELHEHGEEEVPFYRRLEEDAVTAALDVGGGKLKPQARLKTKLVAEKSNGGEFAHYLEQIVDHYIEARRYTHNSRAVFLHPADGQKGFYGQLAQFAAESSMLDFDQMMLLPDNDVFQSAFGLYNKMIEEGFAKNDWRHSAFMFTPKENEHLTQIEKRIMGQLKAMYSDRPEITDERLSAALTMAVGASRGMFLTEVEMAAHADPHLNIKGESTFTSYYNQDATALMAFNPQHLLARFAGGPNLLDPIFFLPVDNFKGTQGFNDHKELWEKARLYKKSFLEGREPLPEKTFFDMLDNIGLIGGPMQRKGWRTGWQLDSIYVNDKIDIKDEKTGAILKSHFKTNQVKTFQYFENIGYELLQDYVSKLDGDFAKVRDIPNLKGDAVRLMGQKKELFSYIYSKYFDKNPEGLGGYLDAIRSEKMKSTLDSIRKGDICPDSIDEHVEAQVSKAFLDRMLARVIVQRVPSKILRMDRDRYSKDGVGRWRKIMNDMGLEGKFDKFDEIMQDMILAEQIMRKDVSRQMRELRDKNMPYEQYGKLINYRMTPDTINSLLRPLIGRKDSGMTQERIDNVLKLFGHIETNYSKNDAFIDKELVPHFKNGGASDRASKYTIALDETDLSFIPFRGGGQSVLARSIRDIAAVEENVSKPITELVKKMRDMAINGKKDFGPIIEIIQKVHGAMDGIIGISYANELASKLASMTIMYMKKDTQARAFMGALGFGRFNSMAAESAGKKAGVWEWDSADIDRFIFALEARALVPGTPYNIGKDPTFESVYVNIPFAKEPIQLPRAIPMKKIAEWFGIKEGKVTYKDKTLFEFKDIPIFRRRQRDYSVWSKQLRENFGGTKMDMMFDIMNKYLPLAIVFVLWNLIKKAFDDSEGKKK